MIHLDFYLTVAGALVGLLVGLTGMGGGALLTPLLVLFFGVAPLAAISSDLVTSLVMKPFGAVVHLRRRTVQTGLLGWLALGSVPAAFAGSALVGRIGRSARVQADLKLAIGVALLLSLSCTIVRTVIDRRADRDGSELVVRPGRTVLIGVIGGFAVGMTSVGAGSLIIALLLLAYPRLSPARLVGTDIVQAIPLVASAAIGHLLFGEVQAVGHRVVADRRDTGGLSRGQAVRAGTEFGDPADHRRGADRLGAGPVEGRGRPADPVGDPGGRGWSGCSAGQPARSRTAFAGRRRPRGRQGPGLRRPAAGRPRR